MSDALSPATLIGIIAGAVALLALLLGVCACQRCKRMRSLRKRDIPTTSVTTTSVDYHVHSVGSTSAGHIGDESRNSLSGINLYETKG